jgi:hypothetical protein
MFKNSNIFDVFLSERIKLFDFEPIFSFRFGIETKTGHHFMFRFDIKTKRCVLFRLVCARKKKKLKRSIFQLTCGRKEQNVHFFYDRKQKRIVFDYKKTKR